MSVGIHPSKPSHFHLITIQGNEGDVIPWNVHRRLITRGMTCIYEYLSHTAKPTAHLIQTDRFWAIQLMYILCSVCYRSRWYALVIIVIYASVLATRKGAEISFQIVAYIFCVFQMGGL